MDPRLDGGFFQSAQASRQRVDLAERILRAMSLTEDLARVVLLVGHGSQSANIPHAAGGLWHLLRTNG